MSIDRLTFKQQQQQQQQKQQQQQQQQQKKQKKKPTSRMQGKMQTFEQQYKYLILWYFT